MKIKLCLVLTMFITQSFGQNLPNGLDGGKYTPQNTKKTKEKKEDKFEMNERNSICVSASHLTRGIGALQYERNINNRFSAFILGGVFINGLSNIYGDNSNSSSTANSDEEIMSVEHFRKQSANAKGINPYVELGGKINTNLITSDIGFQLEEVRFYAGFSVRRYNENRIITPNGFLVDNNPKTTIQRTGGLIKIGMQAYQESVMMTEYYIGFGYMNYRLPEFKKDENFVSVYAKNGNTKQETIPFFAVGLLWGLTF
jgi:hypothetical protein